MDNNEIIAVPQKELDAVKAKVARKMLSVTERSVDAMEAISHRLDSIDEAIASAVNLDEANLTELMMFFNQQKESFRLRQDFLKCLSGYEADTSKVPVEHVKDHNSVAISEDDAARIKAEIEHRDKAKEDT